MLFSVILLLFSHRLCSVVALALVVAGRTESVVGPKTDKMATIAAAAAASDHHRTCETAKAPLASKMPPLEHQHDAIFAFGNEFCDEAPP